MRGAEVPRRFCVKCALLFTTVPITLHWLVTAFLIHLLYLSGPVGV